MGTYTQFLDEGFVQDFLPTVPELDLARSKITGVEIIPLKVKKSKKRAVLRFRLSIRATGSPPIVHFLLVGKFRRSHKGREEFEIMRELWTNGFDCSDHLGICRPIAYVEDWHLTLLSSAKGIGLDQILMSGHDSFGSGLTQAARWLAKLHQTRIAGARVYPIGDELEKLEDRFERIAERFKKKHPSLGERGRRVSEEIHHRVRSADPESFTPVHGDYLPKNVIVDGSNVTVIDLGRIRIFDPAKDVGKFIGHMRKRIWAGGVGFDPDACKRLFLSEYGKIRPISPEFVERIAAYEARCYLRLSPKQDEPESALYWLQRAEKSLKAVANAPGKMESISVISSSPREILRRVGARRSSTIL